MELFIEMTCLKDMSSLYSYTKPIVRLKRKNESQGWMKLFKEMTQRDDMSLRHVISPFLHGAH